VSFGVDNLKINSDIRGRKNQNMCEEFMVSERRSSAPAALSFSDKPTTRN
jgi:hypothetical protein